jgi:hypothetical protein
MEQSNYQNKRRNCKDRSPMAPVKAFFWAKGAARIDTAVEAISAKCLTKYLVKICLELSEKSR